MTRREFIESVGATCQNWQWSWSFVNQAERFVVFGAWDRNTAGRKSMILSESWMTNNRGRKNPGFKQSRDHIRLGKKATHSRPFRWSIPMREKTRMASDQRRLRD